MCHLPRKVVKTVVKRYSESKQRSGKCQRLEAEIPPFFEVSRNHAARARDFLPIFADPDRKTLYPMTAIIQCPLLSCLVGDANAPVFRVRAGGTRSRRRGRPPGDRAPA